MDKTQRIFTSLLWGILVLMMVSIVGAGLWARRRVQNPELPVLFDAPQYRLVDQSGQPFGSGDLRGSPYILDFIFTNCAGVCPAMTMKLADIGKEIAQPSVRLVSFTVDPTRDTPEVLKAYGERFGADPARWHFLTGSQHDMNDVARGMNLTAIPMADGSDQFMHDEHFLLVDGNGQVRGLYSTREPDSMKRLVADADRLAGESSKQGSKS